MGRGKLTMELIKKDKARMVTYQKRKKGLKKKVEEFSTLCGVPTCMIIFGPKMNNQPVAVEFWPTERNQFMKVINLYREKATFAVRGIKSQNLFDFLANRKKKLEEKVVKLRKANFEAKFPGGWNEKLSNSSDDQLKLVLGSIDTVLEVVRRKIVMAKEEHVLFQDNMELEVILNRQENVSSVKEQLDIMQFPAYNNYQVLDHHHHQAVQMIPFDYLNHVNNPMTMLNGGDLTEFGGASSRTVTYGQLTHPMYVDPIAAMLENPRGMCFYGSTLQPLTPFEQLPVLPNFPSEKQHVAQFNPELYRDINQFGTKSKRRRL